MAKMLMLRWKPINTGNGIWFDSNLIVLNGTSGVHIESKKSNLDVTTFQSMTGGKFVTCFQDYFGEVWDKIISTMECCHEYKELTEESGKWRDTCQ